MIGGDGQGCNLGCSSLWYGLIQRDLRIWPELRREPLRRRRTPPRSSFGDGALVQAWASSYWETTDAGMRPRSLTSMPCCFAHSRTAGER